MGRRGPTPDDTRYRDKDWLVEKYVKEQRGMADIANEVDSNSSTIKYWLEKHDIEVRDRSFQRTPDEPYTNEEWLREKYIDAQMTTREIASEAGCSKGTIERWLKRLEIPVRDSGETSKLRGSHKEENNPNWRGGFTRDHFYDSTAWAKTREQVWERDNHTCQKCGNETDELIAHHIKPKGEVNDPLDKENLITWCRSCHSAYHGSKQATK